MSRIVSWTGHRPDIFRDPDGARAAVDTIAHELVAHAKPEQFLVGGQCGVDTWAAHAAITLDVPFTLILPFEVAQFTSNWSSADRAVLEFVVAQANEVRIVGPSSDPAAAYSERNRQLATRADLLVAVWTQLQGGGTAETVALAKAAGTPIREVVLPIAQIAHSAHGRGI